MTPPAAATLPPTSAPDHLPPGLARWTATEGHRLVIGLGDDVDVVALPLAVAEAAGDAYDAVVFDLAEVACFDTALLTAVLRCEAGLAISGVDVRLRNPSPLARRTLVITSLTALIE